MISKHLANMMNGDLTATSVLGRGSTFVLTLEVQPAAECAERRTSNNGSNGAC
jgi:signal transduction histidine kinase